MYLHCRRKLRDDDYDTIKPGVPAKRQPGAEGYAYGAGGFITNRGRPAHVLLSFEEYQHITGTKRSLVDALSMPGLADIEVEFPKSRHLPRPADLS